ncbi:MAG: hypothetical protein ACXW02_08135, partial [Halobacteriota archaeon]
VWKLPSGSSNRKRPVGRASTDILMYRVASWGRSSGQVTMMTRRGVGKAILLYHRVKIPLPVFPFQDQRK